MMAYISAEWRKLNKTQLLLVGFVLFFISSFIGLSTYYLNRSVFIDDTQSLVMWGQLTLFNSQIFFPALLAIFMGISLMPEFERTTLEMLRANNVFIAKLLLSKLVSLVLILLPLQCLLVVTWFIALSIDHINVVNEILVHMKWVLLSVIGAVSILSLQAFILAKTRNFAKSVGVSAIGAIGGLVLLFINESLTKYYPYSLVMIALRSRALKDFQTLDLIIFIIVSSIYSFIFFKLTCKELANS